MNTETIQRLKKLPRRADEVWRGGWFRLRTWLLDDRDKPIRPRACMWVAVRAGLFARPIIGSPEGSSCEQAVEQLIVLAEDPDLGGYLPGRIEVQDPKLAEHLRAALGDLDIEILLCDRLPDVEDVVRNMGHRDGDPPIPPGPLAGKGVTFKHMQRFAEAAKGFYEARPWEQLTDDDLIVAEAPKAPAGMKCAVVMGHGGQTRGLVFFAEPTEFWEMSRTNDPPRWFADYRRSVWNLTFNEIVDLPFDDADLWEDEGLCVAGESAYPLLVSVSPQGKVSRADGARLVYVEGLMRALAGSSEQQLDAGRWSIEVETIEGTTEYTLTLPGLLDPPDLKVLRDRGGMPDRRAMEKIHAQMERFLEGKDFGSVEAMNAAMAEQFQHRSFDDARFPPRNALEEAQDLCYQAFDSVGRRRLQLARQALSVSADCADAYVLLAEHACEVQKAADLYAQGVAAGERALGPALMEEYVGRFWGISATRPYMRARLGLAETLENLGRLEEAAEHYRELLRLNPEDNQGVRHSYLPLMLRLGRDAEAARYMKQSQGEATANWAYTLALLAYRLGGDNRESRAELRKALNLNRYVPTCLDREIEVYDLPETYSLGSPEEGLICAYELRGAIAATPGAAEWFKTQSRTILESPTRRAGPAARNDRTARRKQRAKERKRRRG